MSAGEDFLTCHAGDYAMTVRDLDSIRDSDGQLPAFAWPGGYPIIYLDRGGNVLCPDCANRETDASQAPVSCDVFYEGAPLQCDDCGKTIDSAYGDPSES
jgi:ribosomal protein S27E